jgi:hypothetical protein
MGRETLHCGNEIGPKPYICPTNREMKVSQVVCGEKLDRSNYCASCRKNSAKPITIEIEVKKQAS